MTDLSTNLSVDELMGRNLIPVRAMNICKRSQLFSFDAIQAYYQAHGSFAALPNIGNKTNEILVQLCCNAHTRLPANENPEPLFSKEDNPALRQPDALIKAYQQISEANRCQAEQVYGNLLCTLNRRAIRALFILYKTKTLAGLIKGLQIKPSAFALLSKALLPKGIDLNAFLNELSQSISGHVLDNMVNEYKTQTSVQQLAQLTGKADDRMEFFIKEHFPQLATGHFPVNDFISLLMRCDTSLKPVYKTAILISDLFYRHGLPPSNELQQRLGVGPVKLKRLYQDNGQHHHVYNQVSQAIKILQSHGLVAPAGFVFADAPYHFFTDGLPGVETIFTNRMLFPVVACFNPAYRMFYRPAGERVCVLFVNKSIESWFNTTAFFAMLEKKSIQKIRPDDPHFILQLLMPFCRHTPSCREQQQLFDFARPLLLQLYKQHAQNNNMRPLRQGGSVGRQHLICQFIKEKNRHCHIDELVHYLLLSGELISHKNLLKYLEKCSMFIKPLDGHLFQLREWDTNKRWQHETVVQLAINFLSAYDEPKHIYTISRYIMKYKNVTLSEVANTVSAYCNVYFSITQKANFGLFNKHYTKQVSQDKKVPAYWLDTLPFRFFPASHMDISTSEVVMFMTRKYKLTKTAAQQVIAVRTQLGEWQKAGEGWQPSEHKTSEIMGNMQMQQAV